MKKVSLLIVVLSDFSSTLSDIYKTFLSICKRVDIKNVDIDLCFDNYKILPDKYKKLLKEHSVNIVQKRQSSNYDYEVILQSGDMLSHSFLYKGINYLKMNDSVSVVYPEITLQKNNDQLFVTRNDIALSGRVEFAIVDNKKFKDKSKKYNSAIIRDSFALKKPFCLSLKPEETEAYFLKNNGFPEDYDFFSQAAGSIQEEKDIRTPRISLKQKMRHALDRVCYGSRFLTFIKNIFLKICWYIFTYPKEVTKRSCENTFVFSGLMDQEINTLSEIAFEIKNYKTFKICDVTHLQYGYILSLLEAHKKIPASFHGKTYDYIMILPWMIHGGADLFAINYLNFIAKQYPNMNILAITTIGGEITNITREEAGLSERVDLFDLGHLLDDQRIISDVLFSFIRHFKPKYFHIIQSKAGYDCIIKYDTTETRKRTKIIYSCYNYLYDESGHITGYAVDELISAYRLGDVITTDNERIKNIWINNYGISEDDILVHNQFFPSQNLLRAEEVGDDIHILWAAHVRSEKNPEIVPEVAKILNKHFKQNVYIDCYGALWDNDYNPLLNQKNVNYCGGYKNFFTDIDLKKYNLFLYTTLSDGTPNVIIEAALAGLPIVTSDIGGIAGVLKNKNSMVNNPNDANEFCEKIIAMIDNYEVSKDVARKIRKRITEQCGENNFIRQIEDMLERNDK